MIKIAAAVEYCGLHYAGWQKQKHAGSIQERVERALSKVANHPVEVICAGRTDAGVHALHQVIHFVTEAERQPHAWVLGGNVNMPKDISILWAKPMPEDFHARYSAVERTYQYIILNRSSRPAVLNGLITWERRPLDVERMSLAAKHLVGKHDFTSYRTVACQAKNPVREVRKLCVTRENDSVILEISANAFLHHMVRNIAGVLMAIGRGDQPIDWAERVLVARDREKGGVTAPADGLYLSSVEYPREYDLPASRGCFGFLPGGSMPSGDNYGNNF